MNLHFINNNRGSCIHLCIWSPLMLCITSIWSPFFVKVQVLASVSGQCSLPRPGRLFYFQTLLILQFSAKKLQWIKEPKEGGQFVRFIPSGILETWPIKDQAGGSAWAAPQHKDRHSLHVNTIHTITKALPPPRRNDCVQCHSEENTH